jgi:hypothetical protein
MCGQCDSTTIDIWTDVFHCLQDAPVWADEDDVAAMPNELRNELASTCPTVEMERQNPLPGWLGHVAQVAAADPLTQQEEERRGGLHATAELLRRHEDSWMLRLGRDQELVTLASVELESHGPQVGKDYALDARTQEAIELVAQAGESKMVDVHRCPIKAENVAAECNDALAMKPWSVAELVPPGRSSRCGSTGERSEATPPRRGAASLRGREALLG